MRKRDIYEPYIGQQWSASDSKVFEITDITVQEDDTWVEYEDTQTKGRYTCRLEAFKHRFTPIAE